MGSIFVDGQSLSFHGFNFCGWVHSRPLIMQAYFVGWLGDHPRKPQKLDPLKISVSYRSVSYLQ